MALGVNPDEVLTCRARLATIQQRAADLLALAEDADPEWYIWGLVGAPFAAIYWQFADDLYRHLGQMGESLRDHVDALDCTAQAYADNEKKITDALNGIHELLK